MFRYLMCRLPHLKVFPTLSCSQKLNRMMSLCQKITTAALQCGMPEYRKKEKVLYNSGNKKKFKCNY